MLIIEYMNYFRKDESCPFFIDQNPYVVDHAHTQYLSDDKLMKTVITKYETLDNFNQTVNQRSIAIKNENFEFNRANGAPKKSPIESYKILGITNPFRLTTTYTFPANSVYQSIFFGNVKNSLTTDGRFELHDVQLLEDVQLITIIEKFKDSNEYNVIRFSDGYWVPQLHKMNVTRHVNYELI